jgi:hypothetical protein
MPVTRLDQDGWIHAPRFPLGHPYSGVCHARPEEPFVPPESSLHDLCNCGYARSRCDRFPKDSTVDAVRFSVTSIEPDSVCLVCILEGAHAPVEYGTLKYATRQSRFVDPPPTAILSAQAQVFLESHLNRATTAKRQVETRALPSPCDKPTAP